MLKKVFRVGLGLLGMLFGYGVSVLLLQDIILGRWIHFDDAQRIGITVCMALLFGIIFFNLYDKIRSIGKKTTKEMEGNLSKLPASELIGAVVGLIAALIIAFLVSSIIDGIELLKTAYIGTIISVILYLLLGYLGITLGRKTVREVWPALTQAPVFMPGQQLTRSGTKVSAAAPKILDTSVIIDGRIADILRTGFMEGEIVIPEFVLVELRHIADSSDSLKRARGRRGLDILNKIQSDYGVAIYNTESEKALEDIPEVDVKLLKLAEMMNGMVVTNDFNLNKVAAITGVGVLNINELASVLKPTLLPGETLTVSPVKEGKEQGQAVAYLDDGTMIVVEGGRKFIGQEIAVTVNSALQTSAGRMIFARPDV